MRAKVRHIGLAAVLLVLLPSTPHARTWYIKTGGTGDAPTIKAAVEDSSVAGDTILVMCGTYNESNINMKSGVTLISETGDPDCVTVDANREGRVFVCFSCDATTRVEGITMTRGSPPPPPFGYGGGMRCDMSNLTVANCIISDNYADSGAGVACMGGAPTFVSCQFIGNLAGEGAGAFCTSASPTFVKCTFAGDSALFYGGGLSCQVESSPSVTECTFFGNAARWGGAALFCHERSSPVFGKTVIASSTTGEAVSREGTDSNPIFNCCDIYGNAGGDWTDFIADQLGTNGNISAAPLFCDTEDSDFSVESCSPCLPGNHPDGYDCGGMIGTFGEGCACGAFTEPTTWGTIKAMYR